MWHKCGTVSGKYVVPRGIACPHHCRNEISAKRLRSNLIAADAKRGSAEKKIFSFYPKRKQEIAGSLLSNKLASDDFIDDAIFFGFFRSHDVIAVIVLFDLLL